MNTLSVVLSSSRAIRHEQLTNNNSLFLPNYLTMGEFVSKLTLVEGYKTIDEDTRLLLLLQASDFQGFEQLQIERNFFTFTKNSSYIFKFFEELSGELCEIAKLYSADVYADYEEHITILEQLYKRYEALCDEHRVIDPIFLPKRYTLNSAFLRHYERFEIQVDGYLTNFELKLLNEALAYTQIHLHWCATPYNRKMIERLSALGFDVEAGYCYTLDFGSKTIIKKNLLGDLAQVSCEGLSESVLQVGFLKHKIYQFIQKGYDPNKIAVILPDENKAELLRLFDSKYNFNFAMGRSFTHSHIYKLFDATLQYLEQQTQENIHRKNRYTDEFREYIVKLRSCEGDLEALQSDLEQLVEFCATKEEQKILQEELYTFEKVLPFMGGMGVIPILKLFMQRLAKRSFDDVSGGKITVMGVLESRGITFDGVVLIDFNENVVPKRSDKDMFLNTAVRELAGLPTLSDREGLQKHYYAMLLHNAKEVAISFVANSDAQPSRFLQQLGIKAQNLYDESGYASIVFPTTSHPQTLLQQTTSARYDFSASQVTNTKLKSYLTCTQQFFYRYIAHLKAHEIPEDLPKEHAIGEAIHKALHNLYQKQKHYDSLEKLQSDLEKELDNLEKNNELVKFQIALYKKQLRAFCELEIERFNQGYEVFATEVPLQEEFGGLTLGGVVDRIDKKDGKFYVLDYKTGSYKLYTKNSIEDATDFQLEFYKILSSKFGEVAECGFYDLKECKIVPEVMAEEKMQLLQEHLTTLANTQEFAVQKCEDAKHCLFCEYKILCERE